MSGLDPAKPWDWNAFDPAKPSDTFKPPAPRVRQPRLIPGLDELFTVQKDLVNAINAEANVRLEGREKDKEYRQMVRQMTNAYRVLNRYLRDFAN